MSKLKENVKMFMFARWISICYDGEIIDNEGIPIGDPLFNPKTAGSLLMKANGTWWKERLEHFNKVVWPNYVKNGSAKETEKFLC